LPCFSCSVQADLPQIPLKMADARDLKISLEDFALKNVVYLPGRVYLFSYFLENSPWTEQLKQGNC